MRVALVRYIGADVVRSQRWLAPVVLFIAACAVFNSDVGPLLTTYAETTALLFPIALWMTWVITNSEDPVHASITAVTVGGVNRLRLTKLLSAFIACAVLAAFAVALPLALANHSDPLTIGHVVAGLTAHLVVAAAGVAIGSLLMQSVIRRPGWAFVVATLAFIVEIAIPHFPPVRQILVLLNEDHPAHLGATLALVAVETAVLGGIIVGIALRVARYRD